MGTEFIPIMDEGAFDMDIALLPGVSLPKSLEVNKMAVAKLEKFDELDIVVGRMGQTVLLLTQEVLTKQDM